jgi:hypothetical protein
MWSLAVTRHPAWLESVLRCRRSAEPSARCRQMDKTQVTLLSMEAMGTGGLPGTATTGCLRARSMEPSQIGAWPVAPLQDPGAHAGFAGAILQRSGAAESGSEVGICFIEPPGT